MSAAPSPPRPEVAVGAVAVSGSRLLLVRRARAPAAGRWSLPGGRVEPGESLAQAVAREVSEETGLRVEVGPVCGVAERRGPTWHYVIVDHWVDVVGGQPRAGDDADDLIWASTDDLGRLDLVDGLVDFLAEHGVLQRLAGATDS